MFKPLRERRRQNYINSGFLNFEARELSPIRYSEAPYLRHMIHDRMRLMRSFNTQADFQGWSKTKRNTEYRNLIRFEYLDHGWIREKQKPRIGLPTYKPSVWELLKYYRQIAIESGEYKPPKGKRVSHKDGRITLLSLYKGDVRSQKRRARQRRESQKGTPQYEKYLEQRRKQKERAKERSKR